jgi:hypothetical protein
MKRILILALAVVMAGTMAACGMGDVGGPSSSSSSQSSSSQQSSSSAVSTVDAGGYDDNLAGLEKYFAANSFISGNPSDMQADFIGAVKGAKYQLGFNGKDNVTVELYEFDPASLNDTAKKVQSDVKSSGSFTIMGQQVPAVLSDSGKYLMIYKDTVTGDQNKQRQDEVIKRLKEFKK